jgi:hypothetical protein
MWPWSKKKAPVSTGALRETLFGDMPLQQWSATNHAEPWSDFARAASSLEQGDRDGAVQILPSIVRRSGLESRHHLEAWFALREAGVTPPPESAKHVYGVVVDIAMRSDFDTLAAYADRRARYLNFSGAVIVWEAPDARLDVPIQKLLSAGQTLAQAIGPWKGKRPPLTPHQSRISLLTPSGLQFGQARFEVLAKDAMATPVLSAAQELMQALVRVAQGSRGSPGH